MAIIDCPSCNKKVSDKAKECSHCQQSLIDIDNDKIKQLQRIARLKQSQSLMNFSFIAMLLFCGGFLMLFWRDTLPNSLEYILSVSATIIGFILYIVTRVRILFLKRSK
ncbi:MAG: zinc ribbon domain-containing protein [Alteromonadaceae bacterium]|nr:zinc ribbon domain-containing protein [Alteromonadaceae bacterium]